MNVTSHSWVTSSLDAETTCKCASRSGDKRTESTLNHGLISTISNNNLPLSVISMVHQQRCIEPSIVNVEHASQKSGGYHPEFYVPPRKLISFLMMITAALLSQYDWDSSQSKQDNVPSQNRVPVTSRWDSVPVTLSPRTGGRSPFAG